MQKKKPEVDIIKDILDASLEAFPDSVFIKSLAYQYAERGGLSKKQLEGLYLKSAKIIGLSPGKRATLEAVLLKRPNRFKSGKPEIKPLFEKNEAIESQIQSILEKYPQHKRVLFFQSKVSRNEQLQATEKTELEKFFKLLIKPS